MTDFAPDRPDPDRPAPDRPAPDRPAHVPVAENRPQAIAWMFAATLFFSSMDVCNKLLLEDLPLIQVVWARYVFHLIVLAAVLGPAARAALASRRPGLQVARSACQSVGTALFILPLAYLPIAEVTAIVFTMPVMVSVLSVPLLGERVGLRRWVGVLVGFAGALMVIRPGGASFDAVILLSVVGALALSLYQILTRQAARHDSARTSLMWTPFVGAAATSALLPWGWAWPDPLGWLLMVLTGTGGAASHLCIIKAYERGPAAVVAPILYAMLIWSVVNGYLFFGDLPDAWTVAGASVIAASGLYVGHRERRRAADRG